MHDIDWIIHLVTASKPTCEHKASSDIIYSGFPAFGNIHTHGLNQHNHREICIPFQLSSRTAMDILNQCGLRIVNENVEFKEGIDNTVLQGHYNVKFISFENDPTLYMILPDVNNKFPGDEGCEFPYNQQEIYAEIISNERV